MNAATLKYSGCAQRGVSLVELMVAIVIGLVLTGGILQLYIQSKQSYNTLEALAEIQENGRYAIDTIARDLRRAGYWGGNADIDEPTTTGTQPPVPPNGTCNTGDNTWGRMVTQRIYGVDSGTGTRTPAFDPGISMGACLPAASQLRGDIVAMRYASPWEVAIADMEANRLYVRSSLFTGRIFNGSEQASNVITADPHKTTELIGHAYYIRPSAQTCRGAAVPALWHVTLDNSGQPVSEELALGVEQVQVQYGVDNNAPAGSVNQYVNADPTWSATDWRNVIAARVWVLVRSQCPQVGYTDTNTYTMGNVTYDPSDDSFLRQLYVTTVMLRNPNL